MAILNFAHREITAKIVYFGAASAGSSTNVRTLYEILPVREKSELHQFSPRGSEDQTWYFDYVPASDRQIKGFSLRCQVYAVPGGITHAGHRREILRGTDAVVFVADARQNRDASNLDSLLDLEGLLREDGLEMAAIPMVIEVNHTDDPEARPASQVVYDLNPYGFPVVEAVARDSTGVLEAHEQVTTVTANRIRDNLTGKESAITLTAVHDGHREPSETIVERHLSSIERATRERVEEMAEDQGWAELQTAGEIEVPFQPADFAGTRPLQVLSAAISGEDIELDLIMEKTTGGTARRLRVTLANRPTASPPIAREHSDAPSETPIPDPSPSPLSTLPDRIELTPEPAHHDFPPLWYGLVGVGIGVIIGLLIGVISFL